MLLDNVIQVLVSKKASVRCDELSKLLESLGFEVRDGKRGGHKVFFHTGISSFQSGSYNCGHGKNPEIKQAYIKNIVKILNEYRSELRNYLGESDND